MRARHFAPAVAAFVLGAPLLQTSQLGAQLTVNGGIGVMNRSTDPQSLSATYSVGWAGEGSVSYPVSPRVLARLDVGGALFKVTDIFLECPAPPATGPCQATRSLANHSHVILGGELPHDLGPVTGSIIAGVGRYWAATEGGTGIDGGRVASAFGATVGAGLRKGLISVEGRFHRPLTDLDEVRWLLTAMARVQLFRSKPAPATR